MTDVTEELASRTPLDARQLARDLAPYRSPDTARSLFELCVTIVPYVLMWVLMWLSLSVSYAITLLLAVPTAGFLIRLFLIQHDCGHGAYFRKRAANDWLGRALGVLTFAPYEYWRQTHATHHATSGNLDNRGTGDIETLTTREYLAMPWWSRLRYRLYRHPVVLFGLGPTYMFALQFRLPIRLLRKGWRPWISTMGTNFAIVTLSAALIWVMGIPAFLAIQIPVLVLAASIGVWLFYVQHQFEDTAWAGGADWSIHEHALHGSSHFDLPGVLRWFTANIGVHHVHHLSSRIPFYRLPQVLRDCPELANVGRLTLIDSFKCIPLVLWDEDEHRLISFSELRKRRHAQPFDRLPDAAE